MATAGATDGPAGEAGLSDGVADPEAGKELEEGAGARSFGGLLVAAAFEELEDVKIGATKEGAAIELEDGDGDLTVESVASQIGGGVAAEEVVADAGGALEEDTGSAEEVSVS